MLDVKPGDLVIVPEHSYLTSVTDNEARWNEATTMAIVVASAVAYVETDLGVSGLATVLIPNQGVYQVDEAMLIEPDEYRPKTRYRLWEG